MMALIKRVVERYPDGTMMIRVTYTLANGQVGMKEVIAARVADKLAIWPTEDAQQPVESTRWVLSLNIHALEPTAFKAGTSDWQPWAHDLRAQIGDHHAELKETLTEIEKALRVQTAAAHWLTLAASETHAELMRQREGLNQLALDVHLSTAHQMEELRKRMFTAHKQVTSTLAGVQSSMTTLASDVQANTMEQEARLKQAEQNITREVRAQSPDPALQQLRVAMGQMKSTQEAICSSLSQFVAAHTRMFGGMESRMGEMQAQIQRSQDELAAVRGEFRRPPTTAPDTTQELAELRARLARLQQSAEDNATRPVSHSFRESPREDEDMVFVPQQMFNPPQPPQLPQTKAEYERRLVQRMFAVDTVMNWPQGQEQFVPHVPAGWDLHDVNAVERVLEMLSGVHQNNSVHYALNRTRDALRFHLMEAMKKGPLWYDKNPDKYREIVRLADVLRTENARLLQKKDVSKVQQMAGVHPMDTLGQQLAEAKPYRPKQYGDKGAWKSRPEGKPTRKGEGNGKGANSQH